MKKLLMAYVNTSLVVRIIVGFLLGAVVGGVLWYMTGSIGIDGVKNITSSVAPFGLVFVNMLKMIVIPVIFFSLVVGAASLPVSKFGRVGVKVLGWYFLCSALAAVVGIIGAMIVNPGAGSDAAAWKNMVDVLGAQTQDLASKATTSGGAFSALVLNMFKNPFESLSNGDFLPIIVFAIMLGLGIRVIIEKGEDSEKIRRLNSLIEIFEALRDAVFKIVDWVLEYSPIGVFFLTMVNFALYGPQIAGTYVTVVLGVVAGIAVMILVVYPLLVALLIRQNPYKVLRRIDEAMIMAFVTRSSAATLPVSIKVAEEELKVKEELAAFSLPLGATINMDGVCVHLPMFAVLAANMFGMQMGIGDMAVLMVTTILASIGTGGVPGGSTMLLFIILGAMGLDASQIAIVVALALGINPILDMFETMNNITGRPHLYLFRC
jgi:proton glutamate symport protein